MRMRISIVTGVEPPNAGLIHTQLESSQQITIWDIPIDTYNPYAAVSSQLVKVQGEPSCSKQWTDVKYGRKADVIEICRRRIRYLELWMIGSLWKPQNLVKLLCACCADCLVF